MESTDTKSSPTSTLLLSHSPSPSPSPSPPPTVQAHVVVTPCAACKILRRRCTQKCVLAPYFPPSDPLKFTIAHRIFGASNIIKLLLVLPWSLIFCFSLSNFAVFSSCFYVWKLWIPLLKLKIDLNNLTKNHRSGWNEVWRIHNPIMFDCFCLMIIWSYYVHTSWKLVESNENTQLFD